MSFINLLCETSIKPLSSVPNCPCNTAWYCYCPFTLAHLCADCAICFKCASLGPGTKLCGWQWLCLIVLGTASLATWVIQSACSCPPATVKSSSFRSFLHSQNGNAGFFRLDLNGNGFSCIQLKREKKKKLLQRFAFRLTAWKLPAFAPKHFSHLYFQNYTIKTDFRNWDYLSSPK